MSRLAPTALFALLIACLIGCSSVAPQSPPLAPPLTFADSQRTTQTATISRDGENYRMLCILEFGGRGLVLVAFTELGQRLLTIEYGPDRFSIDLSPTLPPHFDAKLVLSDLQLVYWPMNVLDKSLRAGWSVSQSDAGDTRQLTHDGAVVATMQRRADGTIDIERPSLGYHMTITAAGN